MNAAAGDTIDVVVLSEAEVQVSIGTAATDQVFASSTGSVTQVVIGKPQRIAGMVRDLTVAEDSGTTSLGLEEVDYSAGGLSLIYTVSAVPPATLGNIVLADGATVVTADTSYSLADIRGMQFRTVQDANGAGTFRFSVSVGPLAGQPEALVLTETLAVTVTPVNDAPVAKTTSGQQMHLILELPHARMRKEGIVSKELRQKILSAGVGLSTMAHLPKGVESKDQTSAAILKVFPLAKDRAYSFTARAWANG